MSGWQTVYLDTVNETNARALAAQLGSDLLPGQTSAGDENYTFLAYTPSTGHDDLGPAQPRLAQGGLHQVLGPLVVTGQ